MKNKAKQYFLYKLNSRGYPLALHYICGGIFWCNGVEEILDATHFRTEQEALNFIVDKNLDRHGLEFKVGCLVSKVVWQEQLK